MLLKRQLVEFKLHKKIQDAVGFTLVVRHLSPQPNLNNGVERNLAPSQPKEHSNERYPPPSREVGPESRHATCSFIPMKRYLSSQLDSNKGEGRNPTPSQPKERKYEMYLPPHEGEPKHMYARYSTPSCRPENDENIRGWDPNDYRPEPLNQEPSSGQGAQ